MATSAEGVAAPARILTVCKKISGRDILSVMMPKITASNNGFFSMFKKLNFFDSEFFSSINITKV